MQFLSQKSDKKCVAMRERVALIFAETGGEMESGNGFASEDMNSGNLGKETQ